MFVLENVLEAINALEGHFPLILDNMFGRIVLEARREAMSLRNLASTRTRDAEQADGS